MLCSVGWCFSCIQPGTQWPCVAMVACSYLPCVSRYMERRGIEVGQVELMLYVKPLQEKRCAGGHFLEVVVCEWALSGSKGVQVGTFWKYRCAGGHFLEVEVCK